MGVNFDRWTVLKLFEIGFVVACLIAKRVTDDEASRLFLYLQKLSREWSLLNNVTWDKVGAAVADATYGGYVIITIGLFLGRLIGELPTPKRISELLFLGVGAILYIVLGSLEFAALDSVPPDLVDNAAVLGSLSLVTAALFLLDMGGPKAKKPQPPTTQTSPSRTAPKPYDPKPVGQPVFGIEKEMEHPERVSLPEKVPVKLRDLEMRNGNAQNGYSKPQRKDDVDIGYKRMSEEKPKRFGIYGKDTKEMDSDTDEIDDTIPPKMQQHSPVWSKIRKGHYGRYDIVSPSFLYPEESPEEQRHPSSPGDPGYVQYTAQNWGQTPQKTPRPSPTQV